MSETEAKVPAGNADVSATIIRACAQCAGLRETGKDCASCGLTEPPEVIELGIIAAHRTDSLENLLWNTIGYRLADRRIHKANKAIKELCGSRRQSSGSAYLGRHNPASRPEDYRDGCVY